VSTQDPGENAPRNRAPRSWRAGAALLGGYGLLSAYLFRAVQHSGDGAAYVLQAIEGSPWERSVHVGYLAALHGWVWAAGQLGIGPSAAANLLAVLCTASALILVTALSAGLMDELPAPTHAAPWRTFAPLAAGLTLLASAHSWDAALFAEVYGPLATAVLGAALALQRGRDRTAAALVLWAVLIHPGAWALLPGLAVATGLKADRRTARLAGMALVPWLVCLALLAPEWWSGGRGLLALPAFERSPWQSLQAAWRLLSRDLGIAAAPVLLAAVWVASSEHARAGRRWLVGVLLMAAGAALVLDRYPDNCGQLPCLWMAACLAPLALSWLVALPQPRAQRLAAGAWLLVLGLCIADATSRHDAMARKAERATLARAEHCPASPEPASWREGQLRRLACAERAARSGSKRADQSAKGD